MMQAAPEAARTGRSGFRGPRELDPLRGVEERKPEQVNALTSIALVMLLPWILFAFVSLLTMLGNTAFLVVFMGLVVIIAIACAFQAYRLGSKNKTMAICCILCAVAVLAGFLTGLIISARYRSQAIQYWRKRAYTNVVADDPAAARSDASALVFEEGTAPELTNWMGYENRGVTHCAAPIMSTVSQAQTVQYWAVGTDCCDSQNGFTCDDAGDPTARSGLVILKAPPIPGAVLGVLVDDEVEGFEKAMKMAAAKYELVTAESPMLVRFVKDLQSARNGYFWRAWLLWLKAVLIALFVCFLTSAFVFATTDNALFAGFTKIRRRYVDRRILGMP